MEIVTNRALENRVIATMKIMGIEVVHDFDTLQTAIRKPKAGEPDTERKKRNVETAIRRLEKNLTNPKSRWMIQCYKTKLQEAKE